MIKRIFSTTDLIKPAVLLGAIIGLLAACASGDTNATAVPGDTQRLFIVEQDGKIKILKDGSVLTRPFLDISSIVGSSGNEQGLLSLAFHPLYESNGYFYVDYTDTNGDTHVSRFHVSSDPDSADASSEFNLLFVDQPFSNHNGGMMAFGPNDGFLYIGFGDGGSGGDPANRAQTDSTFLGKILRIDVDGGTPYGIPVTNPYVGNPGVPDEFWAKGLRNVPPRHHRTGAQR